MAGAVARAAHAKVNLHLGIYEGRDERGYHRADSIMIALALHDEVLAEPAETLQVTVTPELDVPGNRTLMARVAQKLASEFGVSEGAHLSLTRHIPDKSGLGSASTDTAAVIGALCELWSIDVNDPRVLTIARGAGADVPFFLNPVPSWLEGVGDVLRETYPPLPGVPVVLARPEGGVSTPAAYAEFDRNPITPRPVDAMAAALTASNVQQVAQALYNNLAPAACAIEAEEQVVVDTLRACEGVMAAQVTGSGSCVFGLCESDEAAQAAASVAAAHGWWSCATATV